MSSPEMTLSPNTLDLVGPDFSNLGAGGGDFTRISMFVFSGGRRGGRVVVLVGVEV